MKSYVGAIDQGTTGTRCIVFGSHGSTVQAALTYSGDAPKCSGNRH